MKIKKNNLYYIKACKRESKFWEGEENNGGISFPEVKEYENRKKYGDKAIDDTKYLKSLGHFKRGLSIGSGGAMFELNLIKAGIVDSFDFLDISEKAHKTLLQNAKKLGIASKIRTDIQDFNFLKLQANTYDLISCQNVLHHLINLEEALYEIDKALNSDGIFVIDDYIGEKKMYRSDTHMSIMKTTQTFMKERYGITTKGFIRSNPRVLTNNCPFECVRSDELHGLLKYYFGGTTVKEETFGHLFSSRGAIMKEYRPEFFSVLELFDDFAAKNDVVVPQRIFGVYKKSDKAMMKSHPRTQEEIKRNIKVSRINEKFLLRFGLRLAKSMPGFADALKKIYFTIRR